MEIKHCNLMESKFKTTDTLTVLNINIKNELTSGGNSQLFGVPRVSCQCLVINALRHVANGCGRESNQRLLQRKLHILYMWCVRH